MIKFDPFIEDLKERRSIKSGPVTLCLKDLIDVFADRTLTVGPGNMDTLKVILRIPQLMHESRHPLQTQDTAKLFKLMNLIDRTHKNLLQTY